MAKVKTETGFVCTVNDDALNDVELLDAILDMESGEPVSIRSIVDRVIGSDGRKELYNHVRNDKGIVQVDAIMDELKCIFDSVNGLKNS